jgi:hypothetical protein
MTGLYIRGHTLHSNLKLRLRFPSIETSPLSLPLPHQLPTSLRFVLAVNLIGSVSGR